MASKTPSDPNSYKVIADMASFDNLPAIHRQDVNGGGGIYQVQEFNGKLYVVVCTGDTSTLNEETGTMRSLRHLRGREQGRFHQQGRLDLASARGDTAKGAKYYYGLDKKPCERRRLHPAGLRRPLVHRRLQRRVQRTAGLRHQKATS